MNIERFEPSPIRNDAREWTAARNIARSLGHAQVMDMTLVARQGQMRVTPMHPAGLTGKLVDWGVLDHVLRGDEWVLVKGRRFDAVCKASFDIAEAQLRAAEALA